MARAAVQRPRMKALKIISVMALAFILAGLAFNQWLLSRQLRDLSVARENPATPTESTDASNERLRHAEERLEEARVQLQLAQKRLENAMAQNSRLTRPQPTLELGGRRLSPRSGVIVSDTDVFDVAGLPDAAGPNAKRSWGPEQAVGEPDTQQAGDIPTAWASREPDGGEEWLKLDYENPVDVAEVRVRETHNPGAISKVIAFAPNGAEVTIWEGTEPPSQAPVEMSFQMPGNLNTKSIKVYLDTKRIPGWNEIDAVELVGRDGSRQWAKSASASSTYAEQRSSSLRLIELEDLGDRTRLTRERPTEAPAEPTTLPATKSGRAP